MVGGKFPVLQRKRWLRRYLLGKVSEERRNDQVFNHFSKLRDAPTWFN